MRRLAGLSFVMLILAVFAPPARAGTDVDITGQIRFRTEFDDRMFSEDYDMAVFHLLRTRVGVGATVSDNARLFVQFQDSRTLGDGNESGGLLDTHNVDAHQAYLKIMKLWADGLGLKLGRFEVALGNERVFGPVGWSNVGRSWEGAMTWYKMEQVKLAAMALKKWESEGPFKQFADDSDFDVYGIFANLTDPAFQFFFTYERDADDNLVDYGSNLKTGLAANGEDDECNNLDRMTIGGFFENKVEDMGIDYAFNAAYQFGTIHGPLFTPTPQLDISAYMFDLEVGYNIEGERAARVAGAVDYTSGDEDGDDSDWGAYNNLYYTGHKWRGYMDYFAGSPYDITPTYGLLDLMGRASMEIAPKWWLMGDFHYFQTAEEYEDPLDTDSTDGVEMTSDVGMEIDLTLKTKSIDGVGMMAGASYFMPKDAFAAMKDPETGMWYYVQFTVDFE